MTTIIEWHDAKTERPTETGYVLINAIGNYIHMVNYSRVHDLFNAHDHDTREHAEEYAINAKRWAELPIFPDNSDVVNEVLNNG